jgi:hypothetical protein
LEPAASELPVPLADADHCREMARKVRELARFTRSPGIRRELVDLAKRATTGAAIISTAALLKEFFRPPNRRKRREGCTALSDVLQSAM